MSHKIERGAGGGGILSMLLLWTIALLVIYPLNGFPEGILKTARRVLESAPH